MKFKFQGDHEYIPTRVTVEGEAVVLGDALLLFEDFLRGMGYVVEPGTLQLAKDHEDEFITPMSSDIEDEDDLIDGLQGKEV